MPKLKVIVLLVFLSLSLCSCFQFIEELTLNPNGSGTMKLTLNMSQSKSKIASIMLLDSINNRKVPSQNDIVAFLNESVDFLRNSDGISNVKKSADFKNYILSLTFDFTDVSKINYAIKNLMAKEKTQIPIYSYGYNPASRQFVRNYQASDKIKKEYNKLPAKDKTIFKTATFISIQRFSKNIMSSKNNSVKVSPSGKAAMQQVNAMDLISGQANLSNSIQLK